MKILNGSLTIVIYIFVCHQLTKLYGIILKDFSKEAFQDEDLFDSYKGLTDLEGYPRPFLKYSEWYARKWLKKVEIIRLRNYNRLQNIKFRYSTDISCPNQDLLNKVNMKFLMVEKSLRSEAKRFHWKSFRSKAIRDMFDKLTKDKVIRNNTILKEIVKINSKIAYIYNTGKPCYNKECLSPGEASIVDLFERERDYEKLIGFWVAWRNVTGARIRKLFIERMSLKKKLVDGNRDRDGASFGRFSEFKVNNSNNTILKIYYEILPLYKELHAYIRYCLAKYYSEKFDKNGPIPAHILGNVWAQQWTNILPIIQKCSGFQKENYVKEVNDNLDKMSPKRMFVLAERFFRSIGMYKMTKRFWKRSMFQQPLGKVVDCHSAAYDFYNGRDFRIAMCTKKSLNDFTIIHHEMGHVQYFMAYSHLPLIFRSSPNSGFHEAIGDTIALSVKTPEHLVKIGLISKIPDSVDFDINYLLATALEKVAFLPFALTVDMFTLSVYNGSVSWSKLNEHWWNLRYKYQGLRPPVSRSENDFDPGSKYHLAYGVSYVRYFFSFVVQFQFYESLCNISGYKGHLHRCDFYKSKQAGSKLLEMMSLGRSRPWKEALKILTGKDNIESKSILKFFEPLYKWLKLENSRLKIPVGW